MSKGLPLSSNIKERLFVLWFTMKGIVYIFFPQFNMIYSLFVSILKYGNLISHWICIHTHSQVVVTEAVWQICRISKKTKNCAFLSQNSYLFNIPNVILCLNLFFVCYLLGCVTLLWCVLFFVANFDIHFDW